MDSSYWLVRKYEYAFVYGMGDEVCKWIFLLLSSVHLPPTDISLPEACLACFPRFQYRDSPNSHISSNQYACAGASVVDPIPES